jgi:predicted DNA-binding protein (MmcQ/YjbR family)
MFTRAAFEKHCSSLPAVTFHEQWGGVVGKVGGKVFVMFGLEGPPVIIFKVTEMSFDMLTGIEGIRPPAYFAKRHWVAVHKGAELPVKDLRAYIAKSHELVAAGLTKKLRAELGLLLG